MKKISVFILLLMTVIITAQEPKALWEYKSKIDFNSQFIKDTGSTIVIKERNTDFIKKEMIRDDKEIDIKTGKILAKSNDTLKFSDDQKTVVSENFFKGRKFFYPEGKDYYLMATLLKVNFKQNIKEDMLRIKAVKKNYDISNPDIFMEKDILYTIDTAIFNSFFKGNMSSIAVGIGMTNINFYYDLDMMVITVYGGVLICRISDGTIILEDKQYHQATHEVVPFKENKTFMVVNAFSDKIDFYSLVSGKKENTLEIKDFKKSGNYSVYSFKDYGDDIIYILTEKPNKVYKVDIKNAKIVSSFDFEAPDNNNMGVQLIRNNDVSYIIYQNDNNPKNNGIIACDLMNMKVLWNKVIPVSSIINPVFSEKEVIFFDDSGIFSIEAETGKELWKKPLKNIKFVNVVDDGFFIGISENKKISLLKNRISITSFLKIEKKTQTVKYEYSGKGLISRIHSINNKLYFVAGTDLITFDISSGKVINTLSLVNSEVKEICGTYLYNEKDKLLFFTESSIIFYDIKNNKIINTLKIKNEYLFYDIEEVGDYLMLTLMGPKVEEGSSADKQAYSKTFKYIINKNNAALEWNMDLGYYKSTNMIGFINYAVSGVDYFYNDIFKLSFKDNIMIRADMDNSDGTVKEFSAYKLFNANITESDLSKIKKSFGVNNSSSDPVLSAKAAKGASIFAAVFFSVLGGAAGGNTSLLGSFMTSMAGFAFQSGVKGSRDLVKMSYSVMKSFYRNYYYNFIEEVK